MAKSGASIQKREKERARAQSRIEKDQRKAHAKERKAQVGPSANDGVDPDIAGIVPGPQPIPPEFRGEFERE